MYIYRIIYIYVLYSVYLIYVYVYIVYIVIYRLYPEMWLFNGETYDNALESLGFPAIVG